MLEFKNKVVIITGAAGGLGRCLAENFAKEGAKLTLVDMNKEKLNEIEKELGLGTERCITVAANVSKEAEVANYVSKTKEAFGRIDVLCNNAGIQRPMLVKDTDEETMDTLWGVNMKGVYFGMKHVIPVMEEQKSGCIVNTGSIDCYAAAPTNALYASSKHAVMAMTRCAALEVASSGIRVNVVCPGVINTNLMRAYEKLKNPDNPQAIIDNFNSQIPLGRYAEPQDIAYMVLYLASDKAAYITGSKFVVDGGLTRE